MPDDIVHYKIVDLHGNIIYRRSKNYQKNIYEEIEINSLKSGLFFLVINEGEKLLEVKKIIIQN